MKKIEVVPRIRINGVYYLLGELPKEQEQKIIRERIDMAMAGMNYKRETA